MRPRNNENDLIIGGKELIVLQAIFRLRQNAYGAGLFIDLDVCGKRTALPQIYSILGRLYGKGLVEFEYSEPSRVKGGRTRKVYKITGKGQEVLNASNIANAQKLREGGWVIPGMA